MNSPARVILAVALVAGAGPAGFLLYRLAFSGRTPASVLVPAPGAAGAPEASAQAPRVPGSAATAPTGGPAAGAAPPAPGPALPQQLPQVALPDVNGVPHRLADYRGAPLLLNFWASWCEPCRREIPLLKTLHHDRPGLQVVGVAVDQDTDARRFAHQIGIDYPVLLGENAGVAAIKALGMDMDAVLPFTVFADSRGEIVAVKRGELHADEADLILGRIASLDRGRLGLEAARQQITDGLRSLAVARAVQQAALSGGKITQIGGKAPQSAVN